ncbi:phosphoribosyltransferase-like protein [Tannerella forsythia]|uniref:phosphoribosyltransferase-like protein n=1 Tax=Tannerella forsythia TaxID=28112 RepID=UPI000BE76285|nr:hypothetical protein [Tannerella forsythia]PDP70555.1 hypothetical protein CLI85_08800 [Tannerella forsythia]
MNSNLASLLLSSVMSWDYVGLNSERPELEFMGSMKYDAYDRFMPGTRFMSSLVQWLNQFDEEDRATVLNFVKKKLVFISSPQMNYLVDLLYDSKIRPILLRKATENAQTPSYILCNKKVQKQFEIEKRSSLVVGLSDGAHTDILRRSAGFSNEQVLTNYYPDGKKLKDMLKDLREDKKLEGVENVYFRNIFLIDDFTASGKSFVRYDEKAKKFKGKLSKIIDELYATNIEPTEEEKKKGKKEELHMSYLLDANQPEIHIDILFCMATQKAEDNIRKSLDDFLEKRSYDKIKYHIHVVQKLDESLSRDITGDPDLMRVLEKPKYLHQNLKDDTAYKVGSVNRPYLGFDECALPVVLSHNTPNNSLPILWQDTDDEKQFKGLFPRISRH